MGTFANSEDPEEMQHNAAFHQGLPCLLKIETQSGTESHQYIGESTCDPLTLCIRETPKRVLLQTVKTQIKCSIMLHFIWVYTVCQGKIRTLDKRLQFIF